MYQQHVHMKKHVDVVPVHMEKFCMDTRRAGRRGPHTLHTNNTHNAQHRTRKVSSPVLLTKICTRRVITCPRGSTKKPLDLTRFQFEKRSRTTRSRFLGSFALPEHTVQLQTHDRTTHRHAHTQHNEAKKGYKGTKLQRKMQAARKKWKMGSTSLEV